MEDLRQKVGDRLSGRSARRSNGMSKWATPLCRSIRNALQSALIELFANAFRHDRCEGVISVEARIEEDRLRSSRSANRKRNFEGSTEKWGLEPLRSIGTGHYGLGLHRSRAIIEAHRGQLNARYDSPACFSHYDGGSPVGRTGWIARRPQFASTRSPALDDEQSQRHER